MARTDNDSWDITEGVGATALAVAVGRAAETAKDQPLFIDHYAQYFLDAAAAQGWLGPFSDELLDTVPELKQRRELLAAYAGARTKYFDDFFIAAGANGIEQVVILAAGLDARAWRLPWVSGSVVYELDQPKVLEFKAAVLQSHGAVPAARYVPVAIDLRNDWPNALREAGFDPAQPTAWTAEGLLPYLPSEGQDLLFERIVELSAPGSRVAVEAFGPDFFDPEKLARRTEQMRHVREATAKAGHTITDTADLWFVEPHADVADWLRERDWSVTAVTAQELMARYRRPAPDSLADAMDTTFVEAHLTR